MPDHLFSISEMARSQALCWLAMIGYLTCPSEARSDAPLSARASVQPGTYYVGQEIPFRVQVESDKGTITIHPPPLSAAEIHRIEEPRGIENADAPTRSRTFPFRIIAQRPGRLVVPSVRVEMGDRSTRTAPVVLQVRSAPSAGRSSAFRGGVGDLEIAAEAVPTALKMGQTLEYRLQLRGPGALGSLQAPPLQGLDGEAVRVEPLPLQADLAARVPTRTFRWRLRPLQPGRLVVPPQRLATFDPRSRRYQTRPSNSITIQVEDVPGFDPSTIDYPTPTLPERRGVGGLVLAITAVLALMLAGSLVGWLGWSRRRRRDRQRLARALAARQAREFGRSGGHRDPAVLARQVMGSLADYLALARDRPPGALTPQEAREGFGPTDLAKQAEKLVERCDWIRFAGPHAVGIPADESDKLAREAANLFAKLARLRTIQPSPKKPREAPGPATA